MIMILWLIAALVVIVVIGALWGSRSMRPYVGFFGIAALMAVAGLILGFVSPGVTSAFTGAAKWLAVGTAVAACMHGIVKIIGSMVSHADD